jgi:hypothetical protein
MEMENDGNSGTVEWWRKRQVRMMEEWKGENDGVNKTVERWSQQDGRTMEGTK